MMYASGPQPKQGPEAGSYTPVTDLIEEARKRREQEVRSNIKKGRIGALILLLLIWVLLYEFFVPSKSHQYNAVTIIGYVFACAVIVAAVCSAWWEHRRQDKPENFPEVKKGSSFGDMILLSLLAHTCIFAAILTVRHCAVYSHAQEMHPVAPGFIPKDLKHDMAKAGTNALVCFNGEADVQYMNSALSDWLKVKLGVKMHQWGVAFSSVISPGVPLSLFLVYLLMLGDKMWKNDWTKLFALDLFDCISLWDTFFDHDPYFLFENGTYGQYYVIMFLLVLYVFWHISIWNFYSLFFESVRDRERNLCSILLSFVLNASFIALRGFLRVQTMYSSPVLMIKNVVCMFAFCIFRCFQSSGNDDDKIVQIREICVSTERQLEDIRSKYPKVTDDLFQYETRLRKAEEDASKKAIEVQRIQECVRVADRGLDEFIKRLKENHHIEHMKKAQDIQSYLIRYQDETWQRNGFKEGGMTAESSESHSSKVLKTYSKDFQDLKDAFPSIRKAYEIRKNFFDYTRDVVDR